MTPEIRKIVQYEETTLIEGFRPAPAPWRMFAVAAILRNPWAGRYVEDLTPEIRAFGPVLGADLTERIIAMAGEGSAIEAVGPVPAGGNQTHRVCAADWLFFGNDCR